MMCASSKTTATQFEANDSLVRSFRHRFEVSMDSGEVHTKLYMSPLSMSVKMLSSCSGKMAAAVIPILLSLVT